MLLTTLSMDLLSLVIVTVVEVNCYCYCCCFVVEGLLLSLLSLSLLSLSSLSLSSSYTIGHVYVCAVASPVSAAV